MRQEIDMLRQEIGQFKKTQLQNDNMQTTRELSPQEKPKSLVRT